MILTQKSGRRLNVDASFFSSPQPIDDSALAADQAKVWARACGFAAGSLVAPVLEQALSATSQIMVCEWGIDLGAVDIDRIAPGLSRLPCY
jgi:hypothetical protein